MKITQLEKLFGLILLVIFGGIVIHAPLSVGLGTLFPDYSLLIKSWKEILLIIASALAVVIITRLQMWGQFKQDFIIRLIAAYVVVNLVLAAVFYRGLSETAAGLAIDLRYIVFFALVYVLIKIAPSYRRPIVWTSVIGAFVVVTFAVIQLFLPADTLKYIGYSDQTIAPYMTVDQNSNFVRINSTLRGPNPLGAYAGMILTIATAFSLNRIKKLDITRIRYVVYWLAFAASVALWVSYSRSALIAGIGAATFVVAIKFAPRLSRRAWLMSLVIVFSLVGGFVIAGDGSFVSNVVLHENKNGGSSVSSNTNHWASIVDGVQHVVVQPFGAGVGSTGSASLLGSQGLIIEDQYLFIAHESGWAGLTIFIALFVTILGQLWQRRRDYLALGLFASGIGLAFIGLLLPVWADDTVAIVWFGLAAVVVAGKVLNGTTTTNKKTARTT